MGPGLTTAHAGGSAESESFDVLVGAAVEAAARSALEAKRQLLGRLVAEAALDDALVDESRLLVGVPDQLEAPHVRCLEAIRRAEQEAEDAGEVMPRARYAEREMNNRIREAGEGQPMSVLSLLSNLGLLETTGSGNEWIWVKGTTVFGRELLDDLHAESRKGGA